MCFFFFFFLLLSKIFIDFPGIQNKAFVLIDFPNQTLSPAEAEICKKNWASNINSNNKLQK